MSLWNAQRMFSRWGISSSLCRMFCIVEDTISTYEDIPSCGDTIIISIIEGCYPVLWKGCPVLWKGCSVLYRDTLNNTLQSVYCREIPSNYGGISSIVCEECSVPWRDTINTVDDVQYLRGMISVLWRVTISIVEMIPKVLVFYLHRTYDILPMY